MSAKRSAAILALAVLFYAIPTTSLTWFDGLPFDSIPKYIVGFVLLALLAPSIRKSVITRRSAGILATIAAIGIVLKLVLVAHGSYRGFVGCYHVGIRPFAGCDASFDNVFSRFGATRLDPTIDFSGKRWRLGIVNSHRFDDERVDHVQIPPVTFAASWTSEASAPSVRRLAVTYTGQGAIWVDDVRADLAATYARQARVDVPLPAGRHRVRIDYRFAPNDGGAGIHEAMLSLASDGTIEWGRVAPFDRGLAIAVDALATALLAVFLAIMAIGDPRGFAAAIGVVAIALVCVALPVGAGMHDKLLKLLVIAGGLFWIWRGRPHAAIAVVTLALLCVLRLGSGVGPRPASADYRLMGDDPLTYEWEARDILEQRSLRAAEDVYFMQIFFRYVRFAERTLFGEGELFIVAAALAAFNVTYSWLARRVRTMAPDHALLVLAFSALLLWIVNSLFGAVEAPLSEYPTWILIPLSVGLLFLTDSPRNWNIAAVLIAIGTLERFNQAPGYAMLLAVFVWGRAMSRRPRWRETATVLAIAILVIAAIPLSHNWWYGRQLSILPENRSGPNIDLPVSYLFSGERGVWTALLWKIEQVLDVNVWYAIPNVPLHLLQIAIVIAAVAVWRGALIPAAGHAWLLAAPAAALIVHVFYIVHVYYPRHILFGYLMGGCLVLVMVAEDGARRTRSFAHADHL